MKLLKHTETNNLTEKNEKVRTAIFSPAALTGTWANFTTPRVSAEVQCFKSSKGFSFTFPAQALGKASEVSQARGPLGKPEKRKGREHLFASVFFWRSKRKEGAYILHFLKGGFAEVIIMQYKWCQFHSVGGKQFMFLYNELIVPQHALFMVFGCLMIVWCLGLYGGCEYQLCLFTLVLAGPLHGALVGFLWP